jgi:hypothetical protein
MGVTVDSDGQDRTHSSIIVPHYQADMGITVVGFA